MTMPVPSGNNVMATMYLQTGKSSLMQRMASPRGGVAIPVSTKGDKIMKNGAGSTMHSNQASTMAATQTLHGTMRNTNSSPFRDTIARGMVTGVGLLGK